MTQPTDAEAVDAALALLSLVTGDEWDRAKLLAQSSHLREVATYTLRKQGLSEADANTFVDSRWEAYAADVPQAEPVAPAVSEAVEPSPSTQGSADLSATANLATNSEPLDVQARLGDYLARKYDS